MSKENDLKEVTALYDMQEAYINMFQDGGAQVVRVNDIWLLFEIPIYDGEPNFSGLYKKNELNKLVDEVHTWT